MRGLFTAGILIVLCGFVLLGCADPQSPPAPALDHEEAARNSQARQADMNDLVPNLRKVSIGDSYDHVVSTLGPPTYEQEMMAKERPISKGKSLTYVIRRQDPQLLNAKTDRYVTIYLDSSNKVRSIHKNNVE